MPALHVAPLASAASPVALLLGAWDWRPDVLAVVTVLGGVYVTGWLRLRRRDTAAARAQDLALYLLGLVAIALALLSPVDALGPVLLTMHMVQHELLAMIAAPLLLLANPYPVALWALPDGLRRRVGRLLTRDTAARRALRAVTFMPVAWLTYMAILWGWHLPVAYQAALERPVLHDVQHLSFFLAALLFWWPVIHPAPRVTPLAYGLRLLYVAAAIGLTMLPVMAIALFARDLVYPYYATQPRLWGLGPLDDQALGWGLMAVIDAGVYATAFLTLVYRMAMHEERMTQLEEALIAARRADRADAGVQQPTQATGPGLLHRG